MSHGPHDKPAIIISQDWDEFSAGCAVVDEHLTGDLPEGLIGLVEGDGSRGEFGMIIHELFPGDFGGQIILKIWRPRNSVYAGGMAWRADG